MLGPTNLFGKTEIRDIFEICVKAKLSERGRSDLDWAEEVLPIAYRAVLKSVTLDCIADINTNTAAGRSREQWEMIIQSWLDRTDR